MNNNLQQNELIYNNESNKCVIIIRMFVTFLPVFCLQPQRQLQPHLYLYCICFFILTCLFTASEHEPIVDLNHVPTIVILLLLLQPLKSIWTVFPPTLGHPYISTPSAPTLPHPQPPHLHFFLHCLCMLPHLHFYLNCLFLHPKLHFYLYCLCYHTCTSIFTVCTTASAPPSLLFVSAPTPEFPSLLYLLPRLHFHLNRLFLHPHVYLHFYKYNLCYHVLTFIFTVWFCSHICTSISTLSAPTPAFPSPVGIKRGLQTADCV